MRTVHICAIFALLSAVAVAQADPPRKPQVNEPAGLLEVESIASVYVNDKLVCFNQGRQYVISINEHLPDARASRAKLADTLNEQKQLDKVVFEWFGKVPPKRLDLMIGDQVPVPTAQVVIAAYATEAKVPVYIALASKEERAGYNRRIYVGCLENCGKDPVTADQIRELLKPGLTREHLAKLLPKLED